MKTKCQCEHKASEHYEADPKYGEHAKGCLRTWCGCEVYVVKRG